MCAMKRVKRHLKDAEVRLGARVVTRGVEYANTHTPCVCACACACAAAERSLHKFGVVTLCWQNLSSCNLSYGTRLKAKTEDGVSFSGNSLTCSGSSLQASYFKTRAGDH